ncbi:CPBP family glutamic-type intramembrane protease [Aquimarina sp. D1M17]|uniref:CPBP family glutamic-type intramembrane protease n=1 Tax=Aquimarina acroporae TaxID=2937283 RepID=UPI0020C0C1A9|nr:CPBP family glutamic-type intramembrane protease [Aquimarina acroporae]MCK8520421.1 CPBP family glutamic-type intramembrane protease [Aquimarina acroporae]
MNYPLIKPKYYYSLWREVVNFVKKPNTVKNLEKSTRIKIYDTIGLYILKLILLIPVVLFFALVYNPENVQSVSMAERFSPPILLLVGGIILPFFEELTFRLSLRFKPTYFVVSSIVLSYYILTKFVFFTKISAVDDSFMMRVAISIAIGLVLFPIVNIKQVKDTLAQFWSTNFRAIYYLSCVFFAWAHITKYEVNLTNVLLLPILTLPQLMSALLYGYLRISFGFKYPLLFHMFTNLLALSLSLLPFGD